MRRAQLVRELTPRMDRPAAGRVPLILGLGDEELAAAVLGPGAPRARSLGRSDDDVLTVADADERDHGVESVCIHDGGYPERLRGLSDPPAVLHVLGGIGRLHALLGPAGERPTVAMVGARRAPEDGLRTARRFGEAVARAGITVISGMAFGIDAASHEGALAAGSPRAGSAHPTVPRPGGTLAVLAGGPERPSPAKLRDLYRRIAAHGVVVSELPPGTTPRPWTFPARNRLIAALGDGLLVIAAARGSGSLHSVVHAQELGRPVGAVPGSILDPTYAGGNDLLRGDDLRRDEGDGPGPARVIVDPDDVRLMLRADQQRLDLLAGREPRSVRAELAAAIPPADPLLGLEGRARLIGERLLAGPRTIESLIAESDAATILAGLGALEADGRLRRGLGGELELLAARLDGTADA
ncbi:DNA-processing protein DprA [Patulibacter sp. NPDC049589]|uniref:DNA-processing protein DprA n=1 Tax=Patulibacter sp. NPDC049589 TaxID=3154731 RepID=UPI0034260DF6